MTTPEELLNLAAELGSDPREAARRAAASRAYYAAFWHLRSIAEAMFGPLDAHGSDVHAELRRVVGLWDESLEDRLSHLRLARNQADYAPAWAFPASGAFRSIDSARIVLASQ